MNANLLTMEELEVLYEMTSTDAWRRYCALHKASLEELQEAVWMAEDAESLSYLRGQKFVHESNLNFRTALREMMDVLEKEE